MEQPITIRHSTDEDRKLIVRLAALDSRKAPLGEGLLAFVGDELRAALPLYEGEPVADPFHPTAELLELLRVRASHESAGGGAAHEHGRGSPVKRELRLLAGLHARRGHELPDQLGGGPRPKRGGASPGD